MITKGRAKAGEGLINQNICLSVTDPPIADVGAARQIIVRISQSLIVYYWGVF